MVEKNPPGGADQGGIESQVAHEPEKSHLTDRNRGMAGKNPFFVPEPFLNGKNWGHLPETSLFFFLFALMILLKKVRLFR